MDESVLWAIAIGTGVIGLLLLAVAGAAAIYWNVVARRPRETAFDRSQSRAGNLAAAGERSPVGSHGSYTAPTVSTSSPFLWIKAWIFALFHAGTVSVVLGGITFFEDLAKASTEIQSTGTVTFPKQLLPGPLSNPTNRKRLSEPSGDPSKAGEPGPDDMSGWEIVDRVNEMGGR